MKNKKFYSDIINIHSLVLMMLTVFFLQACTPKKLVRPDTTPSTDTTVIKKTWTPQDYLNNYIVYSTFKGTPSVDVNFPQISQSVDLNIKSEHNNKTLALVRAGGFGLTIEAAQLYLNNDSIVMLDKINTQYYLLDWDNAQKLLKLPLSLSMFQNLIVGNPPILSDKHQQFIEQDNIVIITQVFSQYSQKLTYDKKTLQLQKIELTPSNSEYNLIVHLSQYKQDATSKNYFATQQLWQISNNYEVYTINFAYSDFQFNNPQDIKFSIPFRYREAKI